MDRLKILVVEDKPEEAAYLQTILSTSQFEVVGLANSLESAYDLYMESRPHLCIVDIYLDGKPDGVAFARKISEDESGAPILFLTGNYDNVTFYLAKTTNPHSYLLKPYNPLELQYSIELAVQKMQNKNIAESDMIFIKRGNAMIRINIHDIKYIEVNGKYSKIVSATEKFLIQQPLKELQLQLPSSLFSRIHRNYIINIEYVTKIDTCSNEVFFKDGDSLFLSRRYLDNLLDYFKVLK